SVGIAFESIIALCITHDHADHIKGAGYVGETWRIPVYTTQTILNGMNSSYCMIPKIYSVGHPILKEEPFMLRDFRVTAFEVPHDGTDNVGFRIEAFGRRFVFATDLGHIPDRVATYLEEAECLVIEANYDLPMLQQGNYPYYLKKRIASPSGHMCNGATAEFLATRYRPELEAIFLCHLSRENNRPEVAYQTVENRLAQSGIVVGRDVRLAVLPRYTASEIYCFAGRE
ncbi:MAG: MBL fold metallo-hydrolase, partial [Porphyromonadaceae bacterium]|nr:MBL fold metallo-hydrolase [Porphyromonadaceae bacterium]